MNIDVIPDITMRGQDDPHGRSVTPCQPTVGQLAARLRDLASRPADWWHLIAFDQRESRRVRLAGSSKVAELWLITWPPGYRTDVHDHPDTEVSTVSTVIAGELVEVTMSAAGWSAGADWPGILGVAERPLRANRIQVHGGGHTRELHNPGPAYAITLHANPASASE